MLSLMSKNAWLLIAWFYMSLILIKDICIKCSEEHKERLGIIKKPEDDSIVCNENMIEPKVLKQTLMKLCQGLLENNCWEQLDSKLSFSIWFFKTLNVSMYSILIWWSLMKQQNIKSIAKRISCWNAWAYMGIQIHFFL